MNKEEREAAQKLIDTPITAENVNAPIGIFFPKPCEHQHLKGADGAPLRAIKIEQTIVHIQGKRNG